jgi:hypothetical protein
MSNKTPLSFLEEEIKLLVQYFGIDRVRISFSKVLNDVVDLPERQYRRQNIELERQVRPNITIMLKRVLREDKEKHRLLADFYDQMKTKKVLPESQDIRHFAQIIGLKEIAGKARKDMIPKLMRFLVEQPTERLKGDIEKAANISEQQRQQGFSVLTDKLLGDK